MQLMMIELAAIETMDTRRIDRNVVALLIGLYIEKGDRRAYCAGNLPVIVAQTGPNLFRVVAGEARVLAAQVAAQNEPWIEHVNALVLDSWEVDSAGAQAAIESGEVWSPCAPALDGNGHDDTLEAVGGYETEDE